MRISDWSSDVCSSDLTLHCAVGKSGLQELRKRSAQWLRRDAPVELLDASQTLEKTGTAAFTGALLDRRAGTIQPLAYARGLAGAARSEEHTSELQSLMRISYAVFCLKKKKKLNTTNTTIGN